MKKIVQIKWLVVCGFIMGVGAHAELAKSTAASRPFTVRDSIEMSRFSDPQPGHEDSKINYSPDRQYFVAVTTRGSLQDNQSESTLWLFKTSDVRDYLESKDGAVPPARVDIAQMRGRLQAWQGGYGALISSVSWAADSKTIYFLGENSTGNQQLFEMRISQPGAAHALTSADWSVVTFNAIGGTVVYTASPPLRPEPVMPGTPINAEASNITGRSLGEVIFPQAYWKAMRDTMEWTVRVIYRGRDFAIEDPQSHGSLPASLYSGGFTPSLSPDRRAAIALVPSMEYPSSWARYQIGIPGAAFKPMPSTAENRKAGSWPAQYALIDLETKKASPLIDAPNGWSVGYSDSPKAVWSHDGQAVLLTNTFLPLPTSDAKLDSQGLMPCAAVVVRLPDRNATCVAVSRGADVDKNALRLRDASFGASDKDVILHFFARVGETGRTESYHYDAGGWKRTNSGATVRQGYKSRGDVGVELREDLNTPPALWAVGARSKAKKLWDPAPELSSMQLGVASIFRTKDVSGYEWVSGLIKPANYIAGQRYPLVIQTHGFNEKEFLTDGPSASGFAARELAGAGILVLQMQDRPDLYVTADEAPGFSRGFEAAIDRLDAEGLIDPKRVGLIGFSRTSYYVENALIHSPQRYAAASITDGVDESYVQAIMMPPMDGSDSEGSTMYGAEPFGSGLSKWVQSAPSFNLHRVQAPLLITAITSYSAVAEWEIYSSLRQQKKPVDFLLIPHGQHVLQNPLERMASQQTNVDWFRYWLQDYKDSTLAKAEQYARWDKLRELQCQGARSPSAICN